MLEIWAEARRNRHENENQPRRGSLLQEAPGSARRAGGHPGSAGGSSVSSVR